VALASCKMDWCDDHPHDILTFTFPWPSTRFYSFPGYVHIAKFPEESLCAREGTVVGGICELFIEGFCRKGR
jgi:hypothetical protein